MSALNKVMVGTLSIFVLFIMLAATLAIGINVRLMLDAPKEESSMSEWLEYLYRCPVCKGEKVESVYVVSMECRSDDGGIMQYLGDQPAGTGIAIQPDESTDGEPG